MSAELVYVIVAGGLSYFTTSPPPYGSSPSKWLECWPDSTGPIHSTSPLFVREAAITAYRIAEPDEHPV